MFNLSSNITPYPNYLLLLLLFILLLFIVVSHLLSSCCMDINFIFVAILSNVRNSTRFIWLIQYIYMLNS